MGLKKLVARKPEGGREPRKLRLAELAEEGRR